MLGFCKWDGEMLTMVCVDGVPGTDVDQFPDVDVGLPSMLCVARVPGVDAGDAGAGGPIGCCAFCAPSCEHTCIYHMYVVKKSTESTQERA
jgi:hypothetical protein